MRSSNPKLTLILYSICFVMWTVLAVLRYLEGLPYVWIYAVCAFTNLYTCITTFVQYRREKNGQ